MGAVTGLPQTIGNAGSGIAGAAGNLVGQLPTSLGGGIGAMTGTAGGAGGTGFAKPQLAGIQAPVTQGQINAGQAGAGNALASQQGLIKALGGNAGNLNSVYGHGNDAFTGLAGLNGIGTMGQATQGTGGLAGQLGGAGGIGAQTGAIGGLQNVLAQQQAIANGTGPNPAQAMLNQSTGQNVANQASLMAGQRGAGSNVGLMARQAAQQGAGIQQNAAGQAATMQAQQQMNALNAMTGTNQALAGVGAGLTGQQMGALNQLYGQGAGATGMQQNQIGMNAGIAQNQIGNEMGAQQQGAANALTNAGQLMGAGTAANQAQVSNQGNVNTGNTALASTGMQGQQGLIGGLMNGAGAAIGMAAGGDVPDAAPKVGAQSAFGQFLQGYGGASQDGGAMAPQTGAQALQQGSANLAKALGKKMQGSGTGESMTPGGYAGNDMSAMGGASVTAATGGLVGEVRAQTPSQKAMKSGDNYANDKIDAKLSEHEVVLPRTVTLSKNAPEAAKRFMIALQAKKGRAS